MSKPLLAPLAAVMALATVPAFSQVSDQSATGNQGWPYSRSGYAGYRNYNSAFDYADCPLVQQRFLTPRGTTAYRTYRVCR